MRLTPKRTAPFDDHAAEDCAEQQRNDRDVAEALGSVKRPRIDQWREPAVAPLAVQGSSRPGMTTQRENATAKLTAMKAIASMIGLMD
jgi:hypothetical protein